MSEHPYKTNVGDFLVISITGTLGSYIAEVTQSEPLQMKVEETGPFSRLRQGDFVIHAAETEQLQKDRREGTNVFLTAEREAGRKVISGLKSLGIKDGRTREISPE